MTYQLELFLRGLPKCRCNAVYFDAATCDVVCQRCDRRFSLGGWLSRQPLHRVPVIDQWRIGPLSTDEDFRIRDFTQVRMSN